MNANQLPTTSEVEHPFYNYTSGRWLYNEKLRLTERHLVFDVQALIQSIARAVNQSLPAISSFRKVAEGGSYRVFEATIDGTDPVIARVPYPCSLPRSFGLASEVATLQYLYSKGLPVPRILDWNCTSNNDVGCEYMLMSKAPGMELDATWRTMTAKERLHMVEKIVGVEKKLFQLEFPAYGSIYREDFLHTHGQVGSIPIDGDFCIGPSAEYLWWYKGRDEVRVNRGPWTRPEDVMCSVGERELEWLARFGSPRFPRQGQYREFYNNKMVHPKEHASSLRSYLKMAPLVVPDDESLSRPTIRHPDLSPNNVFVSDDGAITCMIDWQHTAIHPLFIQAKVPKHFQNYGDEESENLRPPVLPEDFESLTPEAKSEQEELYRRRQLHYFYVGHTSRNNEQHFRAMSKHDLIIRNKLFEAAGRPWEGDNTSLKAELIHACRQWPKIARSRARHAPCPVHFSKEEEAACLEIEKKQLEADSQVQLLRDCFPINVEGWTPTELFEEAKFKADDVRAQMIAMGESDQEKREIEELWPFQDHEEVD